MIELNKKETIQKTEKWIWVEGYKGTEKDMRCRDYQFELGKQFDMPEDEKIEICESGFHFCLQLSDVFGYYPIGRGNRYFKVKALVRKEDDESYGKRVGFKSYLPCRVDKLTSKSIIFERELDVDEILDNIIRCQSSVPEHWTLERKKEALETTPVEVERNIKKDVLIAFGYSEQLTDYIIKKRDFDFALAYALGSQKDISMDTRVDILFRNKPIKNQ